MLIVHNTFLHLMPWVHEDLIHNLQNGSNDSGFEDSNTPAKYNLFGHVGHWMTVHAIRPENNAYSCLLLEKKSTGFFSLSAESLSVHLTSASLIR